MDNTKTHLPLQIARDIQLWIILLLTAFVILASGCARPVTAGLEIDESELEEEERRHLEEIQLAQLRLEEAVFQNRMDQAERLWRMTASMSRAALDMCSEKVRKISGFVIMNLSDFDSKEHDMATKFGVEHRPKVMGILEGSPAADSGIRVGDIVLAMDGTSFEGNGEISLSDFREERYRELASDGSMKIEVLRSGRPHTFHIATQEICDYGASLIPSQDPEAFADGSKIFVSLPMMMFLEEDIDLATVVAHELAHNIMRHHDAIQLNVIGGAIVDLAIGLASDWYYGGDIATRFARHVHSHEFEAEADYVALYIMARAGMEIDSAPEIWRKWSVLRGNISKFVSSHPSNPARFLIMAKAIDEIKQKKANGEPLLPNIREGAESGLVVPGYISDS